MQPNWLQLAQTDGGGEEEKKRVIKSVSIDLPDKNQRVLSPPAADKGV